MTLSTVNVNAKYAYSVKMQALCIAKKEIYEKALPILQQFEGKKITRHIANKIQAAFPDHYVAYDTSYGMFHINIWMKRTTPAEQQENVRIHLGYDTNPVYSHAFTTDSNRGYLNIPDYRLPELKQLLTEYNRRAEEFNNYVEGLGQVYYVINARD